MPNIDVVMDVVRREGLYLVLRKAERYREQRDRYAASPWEIPGGKIKEGEEPYTKEEIRKAALRELGEETGLDGAVVGYGEPYDRVQHESSSRYVITFYPVLISAASGTGELGEKNTAEHDRARWVAEDEFGDTVTENERVAFERVV